MKFYYNGQLVRTSKNHEYTHAVIDTTDGKAVGCRVGEDKAQAIISTEVSQTQRSINNCKNAIKAMEQGKSGYYYKDGRRTYYCKFGTRTADDYRERIEWLESYIDRINATWKVVELEVR